MRANKEYIQGIFNRSWHLYIPFFQRSYVWEAEQWERFLTDMHDICQYEQEYFLGSVILKKEQENSENKVIVDGQQRLTTLILFFKVLLLMQEKNEEFDILFKKRDGKSILQHNKNDRNSFEIILNLGTLQKLEKPRNKIEECYNFFIENINKDELIFDDLLKYIAFVSIELESYENEQQIFDTINSFGVNLTTAELLKNQFFKNDEIEFYDKYWQSVFESDSEAIQYWNKVINKKDNRTLIDVFLFSFLQIQVQNKDFSPNEKRSFGQITHLLKSYKKFIPKIDDKAVFFKELAECATIFRQSINPDIAEKRLETQLDRINLIIFESNLFSVVPYVIFVLTELQHNAEEQDKLLSVLESYLIRRMIGIDKGTLIAQDYAELFGTRLIANNIVSANALKIYFNRYKENSLNFVPTDNQIKLLIKNKTQTQAKAVLVLYLLDNIKRKEQNLEPLFGFDKYSADYFMPIKWQKNWSRPLDEQTRQVAVKTLGNMTITPQKLNNALKDANWHERVNGKGKMKGLLAHNHLLIAKPILQRTEWTDDNIFTNNERLAKFINETWKLT